MFYGHTWKMNKEYHCPISKLFYNVGFHVFVTLEDAISVLEEYTLRRQLTDMDDNKPNDLVIVKVEVDDFKVRGFNSEFTEIAEEVWMKCKIVSVVQNKNTTCPP